MEKLLFLRDFKSKINVKCKKVKIKGKIKIKFCDKLVLRILMRHFDSEDEYF